MAASIESHGPDCPACAALRQALAAHAVGRVWHCSEHGPFPARTEADRCREPACALCAWESPLAAAVRQFAAGAGCQPSRHRGVLTATYHLDELLDGLPPALLHRLEHLVLAYP